MVAFKEKNDLKFTPESFVYIFSGTLNLFNTTICAEVKELSKTRFVILLREYEDIPVVISSYPQIITISVYRKSILSRMPVLLRGLIAGLDHKRLFLSIYKKYPPSVVIMHSDTDFAACMAVKIAKSKYRSLIIRRTPSLVLNPRADFVWLNRLSSPIIRGMIAIYHHYILMFLLIGATEPIRHWPKEGQHQRKASKFIFDISCCYSDICQYWLSTIGEESIVLNVPAVQINYPISTLRPNSVLLVPSNDIVFVEGHLGIKTDAATEYWLRKIGSLASAFLDQNVSVSIKFKTEFETKLFEDFAKKININDVNVISPKVDVYSIINDYPIVAGFVTTVLWMQSLTNTEQQLVSYELLQHPFYSTFSRSDRIYFLPNNCSLPDELSKIVGTIHSNKLRERVIEADKTGQQAFFTMANLVDKAVNVSRESCYER
jgi:hypothetical protein